ncbi:MAG TPA: TonB family protein [Sphingopyxis sp.]|nr:TonB family protein [Sphingopyxis sp.]
MRDLSMFVVLAAFALSGAAAAKEPLRLKPSSKWNVHYADDSCRMGRSFGTGDQKVVLVADRYQPGGDLRLSFVGKPVHTRVDEGVVRIRFGPAEAEQEVRFFPGLLADKTPTLILQRGIGIAPYPPEVLKAYEAAIEAEKYDFEWPEITPEREAAVTYIEVKRSVRQPFILETGSLGAPLAALEKCTDELLGHWGIDVARHASLSRPVRTKSNPGNWVKSRDYPDDMLRAGKRAIVHFRLNVDAAGRPTACHIQQSTRPKAFDDAVCKAIMRNAEFDPALDAEGNPIASYWLNSVVFHI